MDIDILFSLEICFMIYLQNRRVFFAGLNQPKKERRLGHHLGVNLAL